MGKRSLIHLPMLASSIISKARTLGRSSMEHLRINGVSALQLLRTAISRCIFPMTEALAGGIQEVMVVLFRPLRHSLSEVVNILSPLTGKLMEKGHSTMIS